MEFLRNLIEQAKSLWDAASNQGRFAFVAALVVCVATIAGVGYWASRPQFFALATGLVPSESAEIISTLESENITYRTNISGSTVYVPKSQLSRARSAAGALVEGRSSEPLDSSGFLTGPEELPDRRRRQTEKSLERTIGQMNAVASVEVHIAQPKWTPFPSEQKPTTASVVVGTRAGSSFPPGNAASIAALVAGSVEGLDVDDVTITDLHGNILWGKSSPHGNQIAQQLDYRRQVEARLAAEAKTMLENLLGTGKADVRVSADVVLTKRESVKTTFTQDNKVKTSESIKTESTTNTPSTPAGPAGTSSNLNSTTVSAQKSNTVTKLEDITTEYKPSSTTETITELPGSLKRLTVAVTVDLPTADPSQPAAGSDITKELVESLVKQAVGFDETRNDQIEVLVAPLKGVVPITETAAPLQDIEFYSELLRNGSLGIAAVLAFMLGLLILRKIRPISLPQASEPFEAGRARMIAELSQQVSDNPETVSKIMAAWLNQTDQGGRSPDTDVRLATSPVGRKRAA